MLKKKLAAGEGVSHKDLLAICEVITHNGAQLAHLEERVKALEPTPPAAPKFAEETNMFRGKPTKVLVLH